MFRIKQIKQIFAVILSLACIVSGCSAQTGPAEDIAEEQRERIQLTMFGTKTGKTQVESIESVLDDFMEKNPDIAIIYEGISDTKEYLDLLYKRLETGNADDLFMMGSYEFRTISDKGYIGTYVEDLSDEEFIGQYNDTAKAMIQVDGKIPAVPLTIGCYGMYVNTDILKKNGIDQVPQTYNEFMESCAILSSHYITPIIAGIKTDSDSAVDLALAKSLAPFYTKQKIDYDAYNKDSAKLAGMAEAGLRFIADIQDKHYWDYDKAMSYTSWMQEIQDFTKGNSAFLPGASWEMQMLEDLNPKFNYIFTGLPVTDEGPITMIRAAAPVCVNAKSPHKEEAMRFLEYLAQPKNIKNFTQAQNAISPLKGSQMDNKNLTEIYKIIHQGRYFTDTDPMLKGNLVDYTRDEITHILCGEAIDDGLLHLRTRFDALQ